MEKINRTKKKKRKQTRTHKKHCILGRIKTKTDEGHNTRKLIKMVGPSSKNRRRENVDKTYTKQDAVREKENLEKKNGRRM